MAVSLEQCSRHNMIRVCILWKLYRFGASQALHLIVYKFRQARLGLRYDVPAVACHKTCSDDCAVFVLDTTVANDMVHPHIICPSRKRCQRWSEQEERNATIEVKRADFRQNGKRRVIQHHSTFRVVVVLIISAGVEWPHDFVRVNAVLFASPVPYDRIHAGRCIAVVRGLFRLELLHKLFVRLACCHRWPSFFLLRSK